LGEDFKKFLRDGFVLPYMEELEQPPKFVHGLEDVGKGIAPIPKVATAVTPYEKLIAVPLPTVSKVAATNSEFSADDVVKADVVKDIVKEVVPLSGLNMQLKRVHAETCMTADRGQRWNLFQAQCIIKGKACKLMIDSGSYCNGISKAVVEALGLSTWRIPEPRHVEWINSCGMLKITHKVCVCHLQLMTMLMRWNAMCCHWRYVGYYLDVHGSMIVMLYMLGGKIHIPLYMMANIGL
jgi:hypothetical protein